MHGHLMSLFPKNENVTNGPDKYLWIYICSSCETTKQDMKCINHRGSNWAVATFVQPEELVIHVTAS